MSAKSYFGEKRCRYIDFRARTGLIRKIRAAIHTGCLTTDMNKVSAFFMEIAPYFIENFDHILFTTDVSFVIMPYLAKKLKGNSEKFHLTKK